MSEQSPPGPQADDPKAPRGTGGWETVLDKLQTWLVVEATNGPTTPEAEAILAQRGIPVTPDILANAGGVTVSYLEWVQDQQKYLWSVEDVESRLRQLLLDALDRVEEAAARLGTDRRTAAQAVALGRVSEASRRRGVYP